ncbi:hypothetical protein BV22DRAFT_1133428 [Leucogyrophana mollusca]|uniref:Uncharacterized protein n=1 Tax=Leucogyrophana mollusca TaxID=85980 RepID=A0ACB8B421_9AGAM|nr:hypothetical protein BV22DRAFT_1133428 [Leucogyrophana mollusca]
MANIESPIQSLYNENCLSLVMATVLVYDYLLTIGQEVEYIWQRPMSPMSFLYYVVRYLGLFVGIVVALCTGFYTFGNVGFYVITWVSAMIMVLRVFAMYNQSKIILGVLLLFFVPTIVATIVIIAILFNITHTSGVIALDLLGTNYCAQVLSWSRGQSLLFVYLNIPRVGFDVLLVVLAVGRLVKDAVDNRVLDKWQPNVYLRMLARDSIIYFLLNLAITMFTFIGPAATFPNWYQYVAPFITDTVPYMLAPHLIISFRYHAKADAIHSGFASHLGTSLGAGEQEMCFATPSTTSSMGGGGVV